jgi:hypothetical protein
LWYVGEELKKIPMALGDAYEAAKTTVAKAAGATQKFVEKKVIEPVFFTGVEIGKVLGQKLWNDAADALDAAAGAAEALATGADVMRCLCAKVGGAYGKGFHLEAGGGTPALAASLTVDLTSLYICKTDEVCLYLSLGGGLGSVGPGPSGSLALLVKDIVYWNVNAPTDITRAGRSFSGEVSKTFVVPVYGVPVPVPVGGGIEYGYEPNDPFPFAQDISPKKGGYGSIAREMGPMLTAPKGTGWSFMGSWSWTWLIGCMPSSLSLAKRIIKALGRSSEDFRKANPYLPQGGGQ